MCLCAIDIWAILWIFFALCLSPPQARLLLKRTQGFKTAPGPKYPCCYEGCAWTFTRPSHLQKHLYIHTGERPFKCKECDKAFGTNWTLTKHMRIHTGEKPYSCQACKLSFSQRGSWRRHNFGHPPAVADEITNGTVDTEAKPKSRRFTPVGGSQPVGGIHPSTATAVSSAVPVGLPLGLPPPVTAAGHDVTTDGNGDGPTANEAAALQFVAALA